MRKILSAFMIVVLILASTSCGSDSGGKQAGNSDFSTPLSSSDAASSSTDPVTPTTTSDSEVEESKEVLTTRTVFAPPQVSNYAGQPSVPDYRVEAGLRNIVNREQFISEDEGPFYFAFELKEPAISMLEQNSFVVCGTGYPKYRNYFNRYEKNRYNYVPSFITTDSAVHTFHLMFDYILREVETKRLSKALLELSKEMERESFDQLLQLKGTPFESAAFRNVAYFNVAISLLDPDYVVSGDVKNLVDEEMDLISAAEGVRISPIVNYGQNAQSDMELYQMDYSQFKPRGHYTISEELQRYFKASMWFGLTTFRSKYEDEVRSALLMSHALNGSDAYSDWELIYETINFFVGECDDITPLAYSALLKRLSLDNAGDLSEVTSDAKFQTLLEEVRRIAPPKVNSVAVMREDKDRDGAITGFRFLGQRFTVDASIFQKLMDRETPGRMLPLALDIPAALGSEEALHILKNDYNVGEFDQYLENMKSLRTEVASLKEDVWTSNLYWSWINMLRPLVGNDDREGYPSFMRNKAWVRKELNTFLGSWTELKRDTILYAKQPMAEMGGPGMSEEKPDDRGYVEPNPDLYKRLTLLLRQMKQGLSDSAFLTDEAEEGLDMLLEISETLTNISEKELANQELSEEDYEFIRNYGAKLEHLFDIAKKDEMVAAGYYPNGRDYTAQHPDTVIADVATDPSGRVLEEATGYINPIVVAFPRDGKVVLGVGVVYSHYEFVVPISERMNDDEWHKKMNKEYYTMPIDPWKLEFTSVQKVLD